MITLIQILIFCVGGTLCAGDCNAMERFHSCERPGPGPLALLFFITQLSFSFFLYLFVSLHYEHKEKKDKGPAQSCLPTFLC